MSNWLLKDARETALKTLAGMAKLKNQSIRRFYKFGPYKTVKARHPPKKYNHKNGDDRRNNIHN